MARGPHLRSAPLALPSVRDATRCDIFAFSSNRQLRFPHLRISAPPPSPQPSSRGIVGRRLRQLRYCVATFPHSASHSLQSCSFVRVCLSVVGRPSCVRMPSLQQNCSARILHSAAASLTHKSCGTLTRPAFRVPAAPCCRQTRVCLDSRGGCLRYRAKPARRAWSAATIQAISSVHNDIKGKRHAIPSLL